MAVGSLLLLLVVAAAAGAFRNPAAAGAVSGGPSIGNLAGSLWVTRAVVAFLAAGAVLVLYRCIERVSWRHGAPQSWEEARRRPWWAPPAMAAVAIASVSALFAGIAWLSRGKHAGIGQNGGGGPSRFLPRLKEDDLTRAGWQPLVAGICAAVLGIVVYRLVVRRWRRVASPLASWLDPGDLDGPRGEAVAALDDSLAALEAEPDARKAVIAAYARMDRSLRRVGLGREPWEAPFEHLGRVTADLGATAAVGATLAALFERAKFAPHPCGPEMKQAAIEALRRLRHELASGLSGAAGRAG
jgi:hypothetical protein